MDGSLDCKYDPDFSCQDWKDDPLYGDMITDLSFALDSAEIRLEVSQRWIDGNDAARRKMLAYAAAIPIGRFASFIAKFINLTFPKLTAEAIVATELKDTLTGTSWYKSNLKPGDILVFKRGKLVVVRKDGTTEEVGAGGAGSGGGSSGAGSTGDSSGTDSSTGSQNGGVCRTRGTVCTAGGCTHYSKTHPCSNRP